MAPIIDVFEYLKVYKVENKLIFRYIENRRMYNYYNKAGTF